MIEFNGKYEGKCLKFYKKRDFGLFLLIATAGNLLGTAFLLAGVFMADELWLLTFLAVFVVLEFAIPAYEAKKVKTRMPTKIVFENERIYVYDPDSPDGLALFFEDISYVEDFGEWYHFSFSFDSRYRYCACVKSEITKGTIEQFEKLFEDKLVRKEAR